MAQTRKRDTDRNYRANNAHTFTQELHCGLALSVDAAADLPLVCSVIHSSEHSASSGAPAILVATERVDGVLSSSSSARSAAAATVCVATPRFIVHRSSGKNPRWNAKSKNTDGLLPSDVGGPAAYLKASIEESVAPLPKHKVLSKKPAKSRAKKTKKPRLFP